MKREIKVSTVLWVAALVSTFTAIFGELGFNPYYVGAVVSVVAYLSHNREKKDAQDS